MELVVKKLPVLKNFKLHKSFTRILVPYACPDKWSKTNSNDYSTIQRSDLSIKVNMQFFE